MSRNRKASDKTRTRHGFEKALVWMKYCSPAVLTLTSWFLCLCNCVRFYEGDKLYRPQSVNEMVAQAVKGAASYDPAADDSYTKLLANALKPVTDLYLWAFVIAGILSLYMLVYAIAVLPGDPMSPSTNRAKIWFKTFFPTKWLIPISMLLAIYPTFMPYIIRHLFFKYYVMNDLGVAVSFPNPAVTASILCVICLAIFFAAIPFEKRHRMDPFKRYDKEDEY